MQMFFYLQNNFFLASNLINTLPFTIDCRLLSLTAPIAQNNFFCKSKFIPYGDGRFKEILNQIYISFALRNLGQLFSTLVNNSYHFDVSRFSFVSSCPIFRWGRLFHFGANQSLPSLKTRSRNSPYLRIYSTSRVIL